MLVKKYLKMICILLLLWPIVIFTDKSNSKTNPNLDASNGTINDAYYKIPSFLAISQINIQNSLAQNIKYAKACVESLNLQKNLETDNQNYWNQINQSHSMLDILNILKSENFIQFANDEWNGSGVANLSENVPNSITNLITTNHGIISASNFASSTSLLASNLSFYGFISDDKLTTTKNSPIPFYSSYSHQIVSKDGLALVIKHHNKASSIADHTLANNFWLEWYANAFDQSNSPTGDQWNPPKNGDYFSVFLNNNSRFNSVTSWNALKTSQQETYNKVLKKQLETFSNESYLYFYQPNGETINFDFSQFNELFDTSNFMISQTKIEQKIIDSLKQSISDNSNSFETPAGALNNLIESLIKYFIELQNIYQSDSLTNNYLFKSHEALDFLNKGNTTNISNYSINTQSNLPGTTLNIPSINLTANNHQYSIFLYEYGLLLIKNNTTNTYFLVDENHQIYQNVKLSTLNQQLEIRGVNNDVIKTIAISEDPISNLPNLTYGQTYGENTNNNNATSEQYVQKIIFLNRATFDSNTNLHKHELISSTINSQVSNNEMQFQESSALFINTGNNGSVDFMKLSYDWSTNHFDKTNNMNFILSWNFDTNQPKNLLSATSLFNKFPFSQNIPTYVKTNFINKLFFVITIIVIGMILIFASYFISEWLTNKYSFLKRK